MFDRKKYKNFAKQQLKGRWGVPIIMSVIIGIITSIFEIPLAYYNSLPRSKMDDNEVSIMIDSVISVLEREISRYEQEVDREAFLANRLEVQFKLLVDNFKAYDVLQKNTTIQENRVVNMVFRKVTNKLKKLGVYRVDDRVEELRALIK